MKRIAFLVGLFISLLVGLVPPAAHAASAKPLNLITSPLPINLIVDPGKTVTTEIRVKQDSGDDAQLKINLMKFGAYGSAGKPQLLDRQPGDDYFDWVKFDKPVFNAPNGVWQTVKMTISVPKTAAFGYYYAVVFSRAGDDTRPGGTANAINGGTAVLVLLDAHTPGAKRQLSVASFASEHGVYEFLPANFNITLHNTGNVHVVPHGNVFILKGKKQIAVLDLNDEQGNILPGSNRIYPVQWMDGFPHFEPVNEDGKVKLDKNGKQVMHLVWGDSGSGGKIFQPHLRMGHYTAHLFAVYDDGQRDVPLEAEIGFWVIPWRLLIGALLAIVLVGAGTYSITRGAWKRVAGWFQRKRAQ